MSQENVEIVQAMYRAVHRHDPEAILAFSAPDIEIVSGALPDQRFWRGHEGFMAFGESLRDAFGDSVRIHPEEFIEHLDHVVVVVRMAIKGSRSELALETRLAHVFTFRAGKVARFQTFDGRDQALGAVGLKE
jgi:ketosteroid isomerase-like protein